MVRHGVMAVEMEAAELYTLAARFKRKALAILTVSDHLQTGEALPSDERESTFAQMIHVALAAAFPTD
jgi:purine-nucleoside phosphorylase